MTEICEKEKCCGCGLCVSQCSVSAISMIQDGEGFQYPAINQEKCIECGKCQSFCPVLSNTDSYNNSFRREPKVYSAYKKNINELLQSSAGGIANAIGKKIIENDGVVFGVRYSEGYRGAEYYIARNKEDLFAFYESKYVETNRAFLFQNINIELKKQKKVLVVGLPCDIAALRSLIGYPDNLYTCKLICRSNTSQKALDQFINNCENIAKSKIKKLSLRYKEIGRPTLPTRYRIEFENGSVRTDDFTKSDYGKAFQIYARPSCLSCFAKKNIYTADLIVGDFQGLIPEDKLYKINGVSLVYSFSDKGDWLLNNLQEVEMANANYINTWKYNWMIYTPIPESPFRKEFSKRFKEKGLRFACHELCNEQNKILDKIKNEFINSNQPVAIWGAGDTAEYLFERLEMQRWNVVKVFDGSKMKLGKKFKSYLIEDINTISQFYNDIEALIVMIPSENEGKLEAFVSTLGYKNRIIHVGKYKFYREEM